MADERDRIRAMMGLPSVSSTSTTGTPFGQAGVATPSTVTGSAADQYGAQTRTVTIDGKTYTGIDPTTGRPPAATTIGMVSPSSGLTITGTERNAAKEAEARALGYTKEYIASRGGINSQGYFNDTPISGQLTAEEQKQVRKPDGTTDTNAMAAILIKKQYDEAIAAGGIPQLVVQKLQSQWGNLYGSAGLPTSTTEGGYDAQGNKVPGGQFDSKGTYVGSSTGTLPSTASTQTSTSKLTTEQKTAVELFRASLTDMGLADLADTIDSFIKNDYTAAQIKLELPKTQAYADRFPGMESLRKAGVAINESTYISNERAYLQSLRAYGLDTAVLGSRKALGTYISNMVNPREFESRLDLAVTRVNENPEVLATFKSFYPEADKSSVAAYLLNPEAGMAIIKKQVRTAEIGAAAAAAGFAKDLMNIDYSQTLVPITGEKNYLTLRNEFQRAQQLSKAQRRLAQIEGQQYSDLEAIGGIVGADTEQLLQSQRRAARETARFAQKGGISGTSLKETTTI